VHSQRRKESNFAFVFLACLLFFASGFCAASLVATAVPDDASCTVSILDSSEHQILPENSATNSYRLLERTAYIAKVTVTNLGEESWSGIRYCIAEDTSNTQLWGSGIRCLSNTETVESSSSKDFKISFISPSAGVSKIFGAVMYRHQNLLSLPCKAIINSLKGDAALGKEYSLNEVASTISGVRNFSVSMTMENAGYYSWTSSSPTYSLYLKRNNDFFSFKPDLVASTTTIGVDTAVEPKNQKKFEFNVYSSKVELFSISITGIMKKENYFESYYSISKEISTPTPTPTLEYGASYELVDISDSSGNKISIDSESHSYRLIANTLYNANLKATNTKDSWVGPEFCLSKATSASLQWSASDLCLSSGESVEKNSNKNFRIQFTSPLAGASGTLDALMKKGATPFGPSFQITAYSVPADAALGKDPSIAEVASTISGVRNFSVSVSMENLGYYSWTSSSPVYSLNVSREVGTNYYFGPSDSATSVYWTFIGLNSGEKIAPKSKKNFVFYVYSSKTDPFTMSLYVQMNNGLNNFENKYSISKSIPAPVPSVTAIPEATPIVFPGTVTAKVYDTDSEAAISGAVLMLANTSAVIAVGASVADGSYLFENVPPGEYFVNASKDSYTYYQTPMFSITSASPSVTKLLYIKNSPDPTITPSPSPSTTPSPTPGATPSPAPSTTPSPTPGATPSPIPSATPLPTFFVPTATPTPSPVPPSNENAGSGQYGTASQSGCLDSTISQVLIDACRVKGGEMKLVMSKTNPSCVENYACVLPAATVAAQTGVPTPTLGGSFDQALKARIQAESLKFRVRIDRFSTSPSPIDENTETNSTGFINASDIITNFSCTGNSACNCWTLSNLLETYVMETYTWYSYPFQCRFKTPVKGNYSIIAYSIDSAASDEFIVSLNQNERAIITTVSQGESVPVIAVVASVVIALGMLAFGAFAFFDFLFRDAKKISSLEARKSQIVEDIKMAKYRFMKRQIDEATFRKTTAEKEKEYTLVVSQLKTLKKDIKAADQ